MAELLNGGAQISQQIRYTPSGKFGHNLYSNLFQII